MNDYRTAEPLMEWSDRIGRRIRLRDLHILLAVVQQGSMARAAKHLAVSQPVVSKVVADIEHVLGVRLLDRDRHGAEPTVYGQALLKHGAVVFDELRQSVKAIEFLSDPTAGELRIGSTNAMAAGPLPIIISLLHRRHPRLTFHVMQAASVVALYRDLRERNVDVVFGRVSTPFVERDLISEPLFNDGFLVVAGHRNRWIGRRKIDFADLIDESWLLPPMGTAGEALIMRLFQARNLEVPRRGVVCTSIQMHDALLARGPYLAIRTESSVLFGAKHPSFKVLPVKLPVVREPVGVISLRARTVSPVARLFSECVREVTRPLTKAHRKSHVRSGGQFGPRPDVGD